MSIYIKGMEMPEHCGYCRFRYDGICHALQKTQYSMEDCPLVPIPPHGDLIDRSSLCDDSIGGDYGSGIRVYYAYEVEHAPVIIPASKEEI